MQMTDISFEPKLLIQAKSLTIEITGDDSKIDKFLGLMNALRRAGAFPHRQNRPGPQMKPVSQT